MSRHARSLAAVLFLGGALCLPPPLAEGQFPPEGERYAWASAAGFAGMMQACAEADPGRKAEYQAEVQRFIAEMFPDGKAVQETFDTMMATEEIKEMNRRIVTEIKQKIKESAEPLAEFEQMCGVRAANPPPADTPE